MKYPGYFFSIFKNSDFFFLGWGEGGKGDVKGQKITHNYQFQSVTIYLAGTVDYITVS